MQELIWSLQPDLIVETGIAHGGSLIFSASMLELNAACGGPKDARVVGVDIDIRAHNRAAIEAHPMMQAHHDDRRIEHRAGDRRRGRAPTPWARRASSSASTATTPTTTSSPSSRRTRR